MAKFQLSEEQKKVLKGLKIETTISEEKIRTKLLKLLVENGIDEMDEEETSTLIDMCESIVTPSVEENSTVDDEEDDEEDDLKKLADEVDDDEEDDEEDDLKKNQDSIKKTEKVKAEQKAEVKKESVKKESVKKELKQKEEVKKDKEFLKINPKDNPDDRKYFDFLKKYFPAKEYIYSWILGGVTIKYQGTNSSRGILSIDTSFVSTKTGKITKSGLYLSLFPNKKNEVEEILDMDLETSWNNLPCLKKAKQEDIILIIEELKEKMDSIVKTIDKKLLVNREKMEKSLEKSKVVSKKK